MLKPNRNAFGLQFDASSGGARPSGPDDSRRRQPPPAGHDGVPPDNAPREGDRLPVAQSRRHILYLVEKHATVIIAGETGSGKSTQIPQYLLRAGWAAGENQVACTQPRRVAAASVAARVAEELGGTVGGVVGFAVRFESALQKGVTRIKFLTDGVLIREMMDDPLLTAYSVIMIDEAHERSLATDMLLGLLKKVQRRRPELRLVISSATLESELLRAFFDGGMGRTGAAAAGGPSRSPALLSIEGRTHSVQVHYLAEPASDYVQAAVQAALEIHKEDGPGDVLIFLTGQDECVRAAHMLQEEAARLPRGAYKLRLVAHPLFAGLPGGEQRIALAVAPRGVRKVVVATSIAETSLTIEGVTYVVDCCFVKQRCYNPLIGLESLLVAPISKASAVQRAGRAGRVRPGHVFRLCTREHYDTMLPDASVPEMQRSDLTSLVLQLKALGIDNVMKFEWLAPPPAEAMVRALEALHALGVLDNDARLTRDIGMPLSALPLEPALGRCLLASIQLDCSEELLTICAMLSVPHIWVPPSGGNMRQVDEVRARFAVAEGDLVTLLNVRRAWLDNQRSGRWASAHCLNHQSLLKAEEVRDQLGGLLRRLLKVKPVSCQGDVLVVCRAITSGMFMNAATFESVHYDPLAPAGDVGHNMYRLVRHTQKDVPLKLRMHASSVLHKTRPQWVVFHSAQQSSGGSAASSGGRFEMQGVTAIKPEWLAELAPHVFGRRH